jgi:hypothetical protein
LQGSADSQPITFIHDRKILGFNTLFVFHRTRLIVHLVLVKFYIAGIVTPMDESINGKLDQAGKRMKHELTGLEIKLLVQTNKGWRALVIGAPCGAFGEYVVNLTSEELTKRFRDVVTE